LGVLVTAHSEIIHMPHGRLCSNALSLTTPAVSRVFLFSLSLNSSNRRSSEGLVHQISETSFVADAKRQGYGNKFDEASV
jgi:hypothetical protein